MEEGRDGGEGEGEGSGRREGVRERKNGWMDECMNARIDNNLDKKKNGK